MDSLELPALLATEVSIIFAYAFSRTLATILLSPDFPGWLAPVQTEPGRLMGTLTFAGVCSLLWVSNGILLRAFCVDENRSATVAAKAAATTWAASCCSFALGNTALGSLCVELLCSDALTAPSLQLEDLEAIFGLGLGLTAWRYSYGSMTWRM